MLILITTYPNNSRQLKWFILWLINSWFAKCVNRINYVKSYYIFEWKNQKEEEKLLIIKFPEENKEKIENYFKKNHPYKIPEMIYIKPDQVWEAYLQWIKQKWDQK